MVKKITFITFIMISSACFSEEAGIILNGSDTMRWKTNLYNGLKEANIDPFDFMADVYILEVCRVNSVPKTASDTITIPRETAEKLRNVEVMVGISRAIRAINTISEISGANRTSYNLLIANMTATISDPAQRERIKSIIRATR